MSVNQPVKTLHLVMRGRVQGVWYRDSMRREALHLGVCGWVRNCSDGSVEAMVQGEAEPVDALVSWAHRGPPFARVDQLEIRPGSGSFSGFEVRDTA